MKKCILFTCTLLLAALSLPAQITLNSSAWPYGAQRIYRDWTVGVPLAIINPSGAAQTWDLTGVVTVYSDTVNYDASSSNVHAASHPNTTHVQLICAPCGTPGVDPDSAWLWFRADASSFANTDISVFFTSMGYMPVAFPQPDTLVAAAMTYGSDHTYDSHWEFMGFMDTAHAEATSRRVQVDAWGTLILGGHPYDALRAKVTEIHRSGNDVGGNIDWQADTAYYYLWMGNSMNYFLAHAEMNATWDTLEYVNWNRALLTATPDPTAPAVQVWPQPAQDRIHISWTGSTQPVQWTLTDVQGRSLRTWVSAPDQVTEVSVADLPAGVYLLQGHSQGQRTMKKIILE